MTPTARRATAHPSSNPTRAAHRPARLAIPTAIAWLVVTANPPTAAAQLPSLVELSAQYTPPTQLDGAQPVQSQIASYDVAIHLPIALSGGRLLLPGVAYHADAVAYSQLPADAKTHDTFQAPELSMMFVQRLPDRWAVMVRGGVGIAGRLDSVDARMIQYSALALVSRSISDRLMLGGGALVTGGFGRVLPLPAVSVRWRPSADVLVDAFVPAFATVRYTRWNRIEVGARIEATQSVYAIRDGNRWPCTAQPSDDPVTAPDEAMASPDACLDHVTYTVASAGLLAGVRLTSTIWLTTFAGVTLYRHTQRQDRDGDDLPGGSQHPPGATVVRTSLAWRLPGS